MHAVATTGLGDQFPRSAAVAATQGAGLGASSRQAGSSGLHQAGSGGGLRHPALSDLDAQPQQQLKYHQQFRRLTDQEEDAEAGLTAERVVAVLLRELARRSHSQAEASLRDEPTQRENGTRAASSQGAVPHKQLRSQQQPAGVVGRGVRSTGIPAFRPAGRALPRPPKLAAENTGSVPPAWNGGQPRRGSSEGGPQANSSRGRGSRQPHCQPPPAAVACQVLDERDSESAQLADRLRTVEQQCQVLQSQFATVAAAVSPPRRRPPSPRGGAGACTAVVLTSPRKAGGDLTVALFDDEVREKSGCAVRLVGLWWATADYRLRYRCQSPSAKLMLCHPPLWCSWQAPAHQPGRGRGNRDGRSGWS